MPLGPDQLRNTLPVGDGSWVVDTESPSFVALLRASKVIEERKSAYQLIQIVDIDRYGKTLLLDGNVQVAESDEHIYHEMFVHPAMVWGGYETILILGGGDGCLVRELLKWKSVRRILVAELDESVVAACRAGAPEWTAGFTDKRVEFRFGDASSVLDLDERFDLILADLTEPYAPKATSSAVFSPGFYANLKQNLLHPYGMFAAQTGGIALGRSPLDPHHVRMVNDIKDVFGNVKVAYEYIPSFHAFWTISFASPTGFSDVEADRDLSDMWGPVFEHSVWDPINQILDENRIETAYYDGLTHLRLFTPPVDQTVMYGWPDETDSGCCW